jgi:hypothetical protein
VSRASGNPRVSESTRESAVNGTPESTRESAVNGTFDRSLPPPTKRTFLLLEAHRPASAVALTPKGRRRARRYENLLLAAAVTKLQRDCLALTDDSEWISRGGKRALLHGVWLSLRRMAPQLESGARGLSPGARRRAEARARKRFETICLAVSTELRRTGDLAPEPESQSDRCTVITRRGTRCAHPARTDGLCAVHHRLATATAPTAIAASTASARRMERSAGLLAGATPRVDSGGSRVPRGRGLLTGALRPLRGTERAVSTPRARRLASRLRGELVAHRQTASATAVFATAAVVLGLTGLPFGSPGGNGGGYPGAGVIGVEGADASGAPGLRASVGATGDGADARAGHRGAGTSDPRTRGRGASRGGVNGRSRSGGGNGASRLASLRSDGGGGSPSGGGNGTTPGGSPAPSPGSPGPSPSPAPSPAPSPSPSPAPQPSPPSQPSGTVSHTVNTVRQGASQTVNGVTRTAQGAVGHAASGVNSVVAGVGK